MLLKRNSKKACILSLILITATLFSGCFKSKKKESTTDTFMQDHGLSITSQGNVALLTTQYADGQDAGQIETTVEARITEEVASNHPGYKVVKGVFAYDLSMVEGDNKASMWQSAFDRYTGTSFEFESETLAEDAHPVGTVTFVSRGKEIDVTMEYSYVSDLEAHVTTVTIQVTCPADYDGVVFQIGYSDTTIIAKNSIINYKKTHTIDELPGFDTNGHQYYYFSYTNQ